MPPFSLSSFFTTISLVYLSESFKLCPLLQRTVPVPTSLPQSALFQQTLKNITATLDQGIASQLLGVDFNTTTFSISIFSSVENSTLGNEPFLWQYQHTAPSLASAASGTKSVDADSIYRIGSLTKVFTVLNLLVNGGAFYWEQPITTFVPELAAAAKSLNAEQSPIEYVAWDEITIGDLASHMSGIGRDCRSCDLLQEGT
jgi:hypothetical protein